PGRVVELPVEVLLAGDDRTGVAAPHRDHDVGLPDRVVGQELRPLGGEIDVELGHRRDDGRVERAGGRAPGGPDVDATRGVAVEQRRGHLRATGVVDADEEHGGAIGHDGSEGWGTTTSAASTVRNSAATRASPI